MTEDDRKTTGRKPVTGKPATIDDVARIAGVSRSAVSRAYTPGASVSGVTRAKVAEAAAKLGYRPNLVARSLSTRRSNTIAIALTRLENGFHAEALQELSLRLAEIGFRVLLFITDHHSDDDPPVDTVLRHQVDAIILLSMRLSSHFALECAAAGVPVVLFNRTTDFAAVPAVTGDNAGGGAMVAEFLLEGGHQRIAIMTGFEDSSTSRDREMGFTERLLASGYGRPARAAGLFTRPGAETAARRLLAAREAPDALFCVNDHMAIAAMDVARREFGLTVGRDISIIGFDDMMVARYSGVDLTTYAQPVPQMVDLTMRILRDILSGKEVTPVRRIVSGRLIVRGSARLPPAGVTLVDGERVWSRG